jgi:signal recognition particle GTPase
MSDMILLQGDPLLSMAGELAELMGLSQRQVMFAALDVYRAATRQMLTPAEQDALDAGPKSRAARRAKWRRG